MVLVCHSDTKFLSIKLQVYNLTKPIASVKKLSLSLILAPDLPASAVGDGGRLMQTILNVLGNSVKYTKEGYVSIIASVAKPDSLRDWQPPEFYPVPSDGHFYLRVQVEDFSPIHLIFLLSIYMNLFDVTYIHVAHESSLVSEFHFPLTNAHVVLQIKDSGCGILPQDIPLLFTKFAQQQSGSNRKNYGAGLGLAICKR